MKYLELYENFNQNQFLKNSESIYKAPKTKNTSSLRYSSILKLSKNRNSFLLSESLEVPAISPESESEEILSGCGNCQFSTESGALEFLKDEPEDVSMNISSKSTGGSNNSTRGTITNQDQVRKLRASLIEWKNWYINHYRNPQTLAKFKNKSNRDKLINFINNNIMITLRTPEQTVQMLPEHGDSAKLVRGWVTSDPSKIHIINLNLGWPTNILQYTIAHEMGHCIYFKLEGLGERPVSGSKLGSSSISPNYLSDRETDPDPFKDSEEYLMSDPENQTRMFTLKRELQIPPKADCVSFKKKLVFAITGNKISFENLVFQGAEPSRSGGCFWLKFKPKQNMIPNPGNEEWKKYFLGGTLRLSGLVKLYHKTFCDGRIEVDFHRLFSVYSVYKDGLVWLDLSKLTALNNLIVSNEKEDDDKKSA